MENPLSKVETTAMEKVLIGGDLASLSPSQRVTYYMRVCESLGLNPLTKPFDYITLNGKMTLYAKKDAADQLRARNCVSIDDIDIKEVGDHFVVKVKGHDNTGRSDVEIGVVKKSDMSGNVANAQMKAVTKAKRRLTLSLCGLGFLDETEIETVPNAQPVKVDTTTGEIIEDQKPELPPTAAKPATEKPVEHPITEQPENIQWPEGFTPKMSLQTAREEKTSTGVKYGEISSEVLKKMYGKLAEEYEKFAEKPEGEEIRIKAICVETVLASRGILLPK